MNAHEDRRAGLLRSFLTEDHQRLDALLQAALRDHSQVDVAAYDRFRAGLLRHIGMEEKILLPAAQRLRGGIPLPMAAKLHLDHAALASLLMPTPTASIIARVRAILADHNALEEGPDGLYELCDDLCRSESDHLLSRLRASPTVQTMPHSDSPAVMTTVHRTLERAGYDSPD